MAVASAKPGRVGKFLREVRAEMRKVTWPTRKELQTYTVVVLITTIAAAIYLGAIDFLVQWILHITGLGI
ncbi:MAG: preprotein translocase subunit SecE [Firmicutes bacterium]|nr:preprotein translocase subunit SecE [Bacillota bacterium]